MGYACKLGHMLFRKSLLLLTLCLFAPIVHAQLGVYGLITGQKMSGIDSANQSRGWPKLDSAYSPLGWTLGAYYDFYNLGPVRLGVDARGGITTSKKGAQTSSNGAGGYIGNGLAGVRASFHTPIKQIKPYVQGSLGVARTNYGLLPANGPDSGRFTNLAFGGFVGADITLAPILDFRAEYGYGGVHSGEHNYGTTPGVGSGTYGLQTVSAGFVLRIPFTRK